MSRARRPWREVGRAVRRPLVLCAASAVILVAHAVLLRAAAGARVAHVLLAGASGAPDRGALALAIGLVAARFVAIVFVPGLLLAAAAEIVAYLLVGPKRARAARDREGATSSRRT